MDVRYLAAVNSFIEEASSPVGLDLLIQRLRGSPASVRNLTGEEGSWRNSLPVLAKMLDRAGLHDAWIALEYSPYQAGNSRADAVLLGDKNGHPSVIVIELKQWSVATWDPAKAKVVNFNAAYDESRHPYDQADAYAGFITHFAAGFHPEESNVTAAAFLHNASGESIASLRSAGSNHARYTFAGDNVNRRAFVTFLQDYLDPVDGQSTALRLRDARPEQGPDIQQAAAGFFQDPHAFPLTDEQYDVVARIQETLRNIEGPLNPRNEAIIVVEGAPGSGKTWICMHLLGAEAETNHQVAFATNTGSLRAAIQSQARRAPETRSLVGMITSARTYWKQNKWGSLDLLIVDEAQRITEYTIRTGFGNRKDIQDYLEQNAITQLFELKKAAKVLVLFIDEDQRATVNDHLTLDEIEDLGQRFGIDVFPMQLTEQHRTGGSKAYEQWVDALLDSSPHGWSDEATFTVEVADSPEDMEHRLRQKNGDDDRMLAGFAWPWHRWPKDSPVTSIDDVPFDIEIGEWKKRWNLRNPIDGYPDTVRWPYDLRGAEQVGSVFTALGFEFDNVGVLVGSDLTWDSASGEISENITESHYGKLKQESNKNQDMALRILDQYRVLLTRARKSVILYSVDPGLQKLLKAIVN